MKKITSIVILIFAAAFLFGNGRVEENAPVPEKTAGQPQNQVISVTDSYGRTITLDSPAKTIVSVAPSVTETVFALGKGALLAGRTDYCDYPAEAASVQSIGSLMEPNIEKIAEINPDIVIASNHFKKESAEKLENLSIKVLILNENKTFKGAYETIRDIARITGAEDKAEEIIAGMQKTVDEVKKAVAGKDKPTVYYMIGFGEYGDYTAGGDTFIGQMIEMAGGDNIAKNVNGWSFSLESLIEADPDIVVVSKYWNMKQNFIKADGYKELTAVKEGRVHEIDANLLDRQGPRLAEGLKALAEIIHPDSF